MSEPTEEQIQEIQEELLADIAEENMIEEYKATKPELWMQALRVGKIIEMQDSLEEKIWKKGDCFLHANTPSFSTFSIKAILEIDLETSTIIIDVYEDDELAEGRIMMPLEYISWFGFPKDSVDHVFKGFGQESKK